MYSRYNFLNIKRKESNFKIKVNVPLIDNNFEGLPIGKITEIVGKSFIGKTKLLFDIIENNQDKIFVYINTCNKSNEYLLNRKINLNNIILCNLSDEDLILEYILEIIKYVDIIMIDNVPGVVTSNEKDSFNMEQYQDCPGFLSRLSSLIYGESVAVIAINHYVHKNNMLVPRWQNAFNKYCDIRLELFNYNKEKADYKILLDKTKNKLGGIKREL